MVSQVQTQVQRIGPKMQSSYSLCYLLSPVMKLTAKEAGNPRNKQSNEHEITEVQGAWESQNKPEKSKTRRLGGVNEAQVKTLHLSTNQH